MKSIKSKLLIVGSIAATVVLFQNCSNQSFDASDLSSAALGSKTYVGSSVDGGSLSSSLNSNGAANLRTYDSSTGDGTKVVRIVQKIVGGGAGLRACTGPISAYNTGCTKDSEYQLVANAWGAQSYNASTDTYSTDMDVSANGWPFTTYFTRYILADGSRTEVTFSPSVVVTAKVPRLQWVYTNVKACVGPTAPAAVEGQGCSPENDTRSNACGTLTCQFSTKY